MDTDGVSLFHVRGTNEFNTYAAQVAEVTASLNSGDCFVLLTPATMYVWLGKNSNDLEKEHSLSVATLLQESRALETTPEGEEPAEFWTPLGGKGEYAEHGEEMAEVKDPRLFQCSNAHGFFKAEEVCNYSQDDLISDDVFILDCFVEVYVWVGHESLKEEQAKAIKTALEFVAEAEDGRDADTPCLRVTEGEEPPMFTQHFLGWVEASGDAFVDPYQARLAAMAGEEGAAAPEPAKPKVKASVKLTMDDASEHKDPSKNLFTLAELKVEAEDLPEGVNPQTREMYLNDDEFQAVFGMAKADFSGLAAWKKKAAKQKSGLF